MFKKILFKTIFLLILFFQQMVSANDVGSMANISEAAGNSAQAAADQLAEDAGKVSANIAGATEALGEAKSDIGKALDTSIAQAENAMAFAQESLAKGDITSAVQAMSMVEGVTDMALGAIPDPNALDMGGIDFSSPNNNKYLGVGYKFKISCLIRLLRLSSLTSYHSKSSNKIISVVNLNSSSTYKLCILDILSAASSYLEVVKIIYSGLF